MNLGTADRILRFIGGLGFVTIDYFSSAQLEIVFLFIGIWCVLTSTFGYCPFNGLMGFNTCPLPIKEASNKPEINE